MTKPTVERTLLLLRHAKAEQAPGKPDHERKLAPRGRKDARAVGEWLRDATQAGVLPSSVVDLALCSTSERTRQTLDVACAGGAAVTDARFDTRIYDGSAASLLDVLCAVPDSVSTVLMVGHAPGIPVLATALARDGDGSTDAAERLSQGFPTCALAVLGFEGRWAALSPEMARLREFVVPRG